jgi:glycosyltransferase involved in cell wall biosynthesis
VKHIFHVVLSLDIGGLETGMVNLIRRSSARFRHTLCCLRGLGPRAADVPRAFPIHDLAVAAGTKPSTVWTIARMMRRLRPDLVRCYNVEALFHAVPAAGLALLPVIYYNGGRVVPEAPRRLRLERWLSRRVKQIVVPSSELRDSMAGLLRLSSGRFRVIENGVDVDRFHPGAPTPEERTALGLPPEGPLVGAAGRLVPSKGYPVLLRAFAQAAARVPEAKLVIAGDGPLRGELATLAEGLGLNGRVSFLGSRTDMPAVYRALSAFASTSEMEGLSNVLLEAMASGVPPVVTRVGGAGRVVTEGEDGLLVAPGDGDAVAAALERVLAEPGLGARLGQAARATIQREFSLQRMLLDYERLYDEVLSS